MGIKKRRRTEQLKLTTMVRKAFKEGIENTQEKKFNRLVKRGIIVPVQSETKKIHNE